MKQLILLVLVVFATKLQAKNYYVSATGNDANDGLTTSTPWKTIAKVNSFTFAANDYILFKRGDTFSGGIIVSGNNLTYDSYGVGEKPIITGLSTVTGWVNLGGNIWEAPVTNVKSGVNLVLRNGNIQQVGRFPNTDAANSGYLTNTATSSTSITGPALSSTTNWTGAEIAVRVNRWQIVKSAVTGHSAGVVSFATMSPTPKINFGYFFQRDSRTLDKDGEWWHDNTNSKLRVYSTANPSTYIYKIATTDDLLYSGYGSISINNLVFEGAGKRAIRFSGGANIKITNCDVKFSGGEGISTNSSDHVTVDNCTAKNCLGSGIRINCPFTGLKILAVRNCNVDSTAMIAGMEISDGVNGGEGILCKGGDSILILNNIVTNSGYNGIEWQGNDVYVKYNFVNNFCNVRDDGSGIYTMEGPGSTLPVRKNRNLISNIVTNGIGALNGSDGGTSESAISGLYFDMGSRTVLVDSNTIANVNGNSFHGNSNSSLTFTNNTFFGNTSSFSLQRFSDAPLVRGITLKKNILYPYRMRYRNLAIDLPSLITKETDLQAMCLIDSNYYALRNGKDTSITCVTTNSNLSNYTETAQNFAYISGSLSLELHSTNVPNTGTLEYNASTTPKVVFFSGLSKKDVFGNIYNNSVTIPAWSSKVLIANGVVPTSNISPLANAGTNQSVILPINTITLLGIGTDADGTISSYAWIKISGPANGTIASANAATTVVNNLVQGIYQFELTVTDNNGATGKDTVQVTVNAASNLDPVANAGTDKTITLPTNTTNLTGTGNDTDGTISSYAWIKISGPATGTIASASASTTAVNNLVQGIYQFELTVTDNNGATGKDTVQVTVNATSNLAPVANAGTDKTITLPTNTANLSGSGTDADGSISSYLWVKISGPSTGTIATANASTTAVNNLVQGIYQYELTVTDNSGAIGKDTVKVFVNAAPNLAPIAQAGTDKIITLPTNTVNLSGNGTDADGTISSYAWVKISGPATGTIATANAAATSVNNLVKGLYQFELTVTDNNGATGKDTVNVTVNAALNIAPVANAGINKTIVLPTNTVTLTGTGTDADGTIAGYAWTKISGPISGSITTANASTTTVINLVQGIYQYELAVSDNSGAIGKDTIQVIVNPAPNLAPVANAGTDIVITLPINSTNLNGSGTDTDGVIVSYVWVKISGPASGTIASPNAANTPVNNLIQGIYQYELSVTDNAGAISIDIVQITVNSAPNQPPVANAGSDQVITLPTNNTTLIGTGTDSDGTISGYSWIKISGPASGLIVSPNTANTTVNNLIQGVYLFQLTVKDNKGTTGKDTIQVTVNIAPNQAPVANAGADKNITLPTNSTSLNGIGTDLDGTISNYAWVKLSGPASGTISSPNSGATAISNLVKGVYEFELTVTDNAGAISKDTVLVTVNAAPNQVPQANAGADQAITLPTNNATLTGSGADADGTITAYTWVKLSGPATGIITSPNSASTVLTNLTQGIYNYELTVTDNDGAISKDTTQVTVNAAPNQAPVANAGTNKLVTLPANSTSLTGMGTDVDGTVISYTWVKISGPDTGIITTPNLAATSLTNLVQGLYEFELSVKDNDGAISKDTVQVTVNSALNQAPVANAGTNKIITLPTNNTTLNGSGTDADGTVDSYSWVKISGPASGTIASPNAAVTTVNNLAQGIYKYELTVTDNMGAISKDIVQVTVNAAPNLPPVANAGADQSITLPTNNVTLGGSGNDTDGTISGYSWLKISGPASGLVASPNSANATAKNLIQGVYLFQLTVKDNKGATGIDTIQVTVNSTPNQAPIANAGTNKTITLPTNSTTLNGVGTDLDGTISSYTWVKISGPVSGIIASPNSGTTAINNLIKGVYNFELTVMDNAGAISKDTVQVTVNEAPNQAPQADAGADQAITLPTNTTSISGSGTDADGTIASFQWVKIAGPTIGIITSPNSPTTSLNNLIQGIYNFELTVTDNLGAISKDTIEITLNAAPNLAPVANAGANVLITLPVNNISLNGSGEDIDGTISSYAWTMLSGPGNCVIATPSLANTTISNLIAGIYQFELTVTDNNGAFSRAIVQVTVKAAPNQPPVANAGADKVVTLPINSANLNGIGTDADGTITSYKWIKISGPALGTIALSNSANTLINNLIQGEYQIELTVTDNNGDFSKDTVKVNVNAALNQAPVSNAGQDITVTLPTNYANLNGSGTDQDGSIINYTWVKISGPASGTIASPNSGITAINNLTQGVYQYELSVTDNTGEVSKDTVKVTVNAALNQAPISNAGQDITVTLPTNYANLNGSGTDPDGSIINFSWVKISGPASGTISSANAYTTTVNNLVQGLYQFELTVTDNNGAIGKDTVMVFVNAAPNLAPIAYAGTDVVITLPINNITLNGSGTDADGIIVNYAWVKISGPAFGTIASTNSATTAITNLAAGVYQYELTVTDNNGAKGKDTIQFTVNGATFLNKQPIANAGTDINIVLPTNNVLLKGTATDPDGTIVSYHWKVVDGPAGNSFKTPNASETLLENLFQGVYMIEFTVVDNKGAVAMDTVNITVSSPRLSNTSTIISSNDFKVYPNPVKDIANLKITTLNKNTKLSISVVDVTGKVLKSYSFVTTDLNTTFKIDMSTLSNSIYFVTVRFDDGTLLSSKVFKNSSN